MNANKYQRITIKIGSNVLTNEDGLPDRTILENITRQITALKKQGIEVILISSGAVASGKGIMKPSKKLNPVIQRQLFSSIGQIKLIQTYRDLFEKEGMVCAQVLVTKEDFRDRTHYLNMRNCFNALLENNIIPIVNENDVISVTELMFTDNDELAGLVAAMLNVDALFILSNVEGVFNGNPNDANSSVIPVFENKNTDFTQFVVAQKSNFGRGGMVTKCRNAQKVAKLGIGVHIANGKKENIILELISPNPPGTFFQPQKGTSDLKKWVAQSVHYVKGEVIINEGAKKALSSEHTTSLLPIGIVEVIGDFKKGDIIKIICEKNDEIGLGVAKYNSEKAKERIGQKNHQPLIHYDYLFLY
ncbi:glutamate 5-kinase [Flexithrix dorotheae]|uniref:glutamate 5-kinase n=1 Tax=Flexithrix dorotheae TaxID=70993 RepID=UPI00037C54A0|nr:glutamate 5-kinase [Flexithrix dorotheae]